MPVGNVLICDTGGNIEHDDTAVAVDVVSITETAELLLTGGIPDVELDLAQVLCLLLVLFRAAQGTGIAYCGEAERVNFDTERGNVLLLELARQMALHEGRLLR